MIRLLANPWVPLILGALLVGAIAAAICGAYVKGRADGRDSQIALQTKATQKHEARVDQMEQKSRQATQQTGHTIEATRNERTAEGDHARAELGPLRVCDNAASSDVPGTPARATATDRSEAGAGLPVRAGNPAQAPAVVPADIGPGLIALMEACQRDHDDDRFWREWWASQAAIASAPSF